MSVNPYELELEPGLGGSSLDEGGSSGADDWVCSSAGISGFGSSPSMGPTALQSIPSNSSGNSYSSSPHKLVAELFGWDIEEANAEGWPESITPLAVGCKVDSIWAGKR